MKNEGFTLVELLAVLLILAFIAIIAVPQILNLIEESKIRSLKLSTESYIRAVNTSLINEEVFNNVKDGLYTIIDDGKKIKLGDTEIYISSEGHGLRSGQLLIEDSKVKRVLKGMIDDYYARVNGEEITILKNLNESTLIASSTFNIKIKTLVGDKKDDGSEPSRDTVDTKVKKITFLQDSVLPEGYTKEQLQLLKSTDLSKDNDNSIKGYYDSNTGVIYVYSDGYISCPKSLSYMFYYFQGVEEIEFNLIDTREVTDIGLSWSSGTFEGCSSLTKLDLSNFYMSNIISMAFTFAHCSNLEYLDLSWFNASSLKDIEYMFSYCSNLKEIKGIENLDTSKVTNMTCLFRGCSSLEKLDLSKWNTKSVKYLWNYGTLFNGCKSLKSLKLGPKFTLEEVTNFSQLFAGCSSLTELDVSSFDTSSATNMNSMFNGCTNLKKIKGLEKFNTSQVIDLGSMFYDCSSLISIDLSKFDTSQVTIVRGFDGGMFGKCTNLKSIKFGPNFKLNKVTDFMVLFSSCSSLEELDLSMFDTSEATTMQSMFSGCTNLKKIKGIENFNTSGVTSMANMFGSCSSLIELNLSKWNTGQVNTMSSMFNGCSSLTTLDVSGFDTSLVESMWMMFNDCSSLTELDLTSFDTQLSTNSSYQMFGNCTNLKTTKVTESKWTLGRNHSSITYV